MDHILWPFQTKPEWLFWVILAIFNNLDMIAWLVVQYITDEILLSNMPIDKDSKLSCLLLDQTVSQDVNANRCVIDEFEIKDVEVKAKKSVVIDIDESEESGDDFIVASILANVLGIVADTVSENNDSSRRSILGILLNSILSVMYWTTIYHGQIVKNGQNYPK